MKKNLTLIIACILLVIGAEIDARADVIARELQEIMQSLGPGEETAVIITLSDKVDLKNFKDKDKPLRRRKIIRALQQKADKTQKNIKNYLKQSKVKKVKSFWIFNGLAVTANAEVIKKMAGMAEIESIRPDSILTLEEPPISVNAAGPEWNINAINAPELWSRGYTGKETVLATMDTGVDLTHSDLNARWRGWYEPNGGSNSWYDPNGQHSTPHDANGHGTNVMGTILGGDAGGSAIGVAPGAQWIAVKIFNDADQALQSNIHAGYQWLLDPDSDPETDDAPDVVNNSWGYPNQAGTCLLIIEFQNDISALKAAQIGVVFSGGNNYTNESPANYAESFGVGAVDANKTIAYFSAVGPSACDGTIFPEVAAPGVNVRTAGLGGSYTYVSGTSIAAPHVAGAMGLLLSVDPTLSISEIETALTESALDLGVVGPDNTYGYGFLDVMGAYNLLSQNHAQAPIANNDIFTIPRNTVAIINILDLLANDTAEESSIEVNSLVLRSAVSARGNFVFLNVNNNTITYTPEGRGGPDYFWYTVNDIWGETSNEATVRINRVRAAEPTPASVVAPAPDRGRINRR